MSLLHHNQNKFKSDQKIQSIKIQEEVESLNNFNFKCSVVKISDISKRHRSRARMSKPRVELKIPIIQSNNPDISQNSNLIDIEMLRAKTARYERSGKRNYSNRLNKTKNFL